MYHTIRHHTNDDAGVAGWYIHSHDDNGLVFDSLGAYDTENHAKELLRGMMNDQKIIFLDIDGPMIPATMVLIDRMASWDRLMPPTTVAVINEICKRTGGLIVLNTTHNTPARDVPDIKDALVNHGVLPRYFHPVEPNTIYPNADRMSAVEDWLIRNPGVKDWIALDDAHFTDSDRLILVDPDAGLSVKHLNYATEILGGSPFIVMM